MYNGNNDNNNNWRQKFPGKTSSRNFNKNFSKVNLLLWKKAVVHYSDALQSYQVLRDLVNSNQVNISEVTFVA